MPTAFPGEYHAYNSNIHYPHQQHAVEILEIDDKEYWTIEEHTDFGQVLITLSWDERTTPHSLLEDYEALAVVAWDEAAKEWVSLGGARSEEHTSELQSRGQLVCRLLLEKNKPQ